ncbi:hypothetical protein [Ktedonospora formicarum]|uniref:Uncharacterized protein n=1 Tax=Ktedonospora formicarum TaxID=2778364 RepID=A0A8J3MQH0_9CHLR|nr:hypothetical protein [Ktedonospora formicarum]GHO42761.1 hypothetical protein KSX_09240 [Ktedonospora formicarum]
MSQNSSDKFIHFTVNLLKDSDALEALRSDALKHHMIDQPGQLIALRLTEYYEMMNKGIVQPVVRVPAIAIPTEAENNQVGQEPVLPTASVAPRPAPAPTHFSPMPKPISPATGAPPQYQPQMPGNGSFGAQQVTGRMRALQQKGENIIAASPNADQNADEAADYWSTL